jgi:hypothetical protein
MTVLKKSPEQPAIDVNRLGWIAVDLDGTLAYYVSGQNDLAIGPPVPRMLAMVKRMLAAGKDVRIFTARVDGGEAAASVGHPEADGYRDVAAITRAIEVWCLMHVGQILPVTNKKDFLMMRLYDDRVVGIIPNTGMRADGLRDEFDE